MLYDVVLERQREITRQMEHERLVRSVGPQPWRDAASWSAVLGPIVAASFLVYLGREIVAAVSH
jgi:hypothetical protein